VSATNSFPDDETPPSALVRPYARTGGRTRPVHNFEIEALVTPTVQGIDPAVGQLLSPEHAAVIDLCQQTVSVAVPPDAASAEVARVVIADRVDLGLVGCSALLAARRVTRFLRRCSVVSGGSEPSRAGDRGLGQPPVPQARPTHRRRSSSRGSARGATFVGSVSEIMPLPPKRS
jgi:hypothetical protein